MNVFRRTWAGFWGWLWNSPSPHVPTSRDIRLSSQDPVFAEDEEPPPASPDGESFPDPYLPGLTRASRPDPRRAASELIRQAMAMALVPGAGTVYVTFDADGSGEVVEVVGERFGPDVIIRPVQFFPLRPRPVTLASPAMLAIQDGNPEGCACGRRMPVAPRIFSPDSPPSRV